MAYVGLDVPAVYSEALCGNQRARLHVTLAFIGKINKFQEFALVERLVKLVEGLKPVRLEVGEYAVFGTPTEPRAVRLLTCDDALLQIRGGVLGALEYCGIEWSKHFEPWTPHVTCGGDMHQHALPAARPFAFTVDRLILAGAPVIQLFEFPMRGGDR